MLTLMLCEYSKIIVIGHSTSRMLYVDPLMVLMQCLFFCCRHLGMPLKKRLMFEKSLHVCTRVYIVLVGRACMCVQPQ